MTRTHAEIVHAIGAKRITDALNRAGFDVSYPTVRAWSRRPDPDGSIPGGYWRFFARRRWSSLTELAIAAERRKPSRISE
jgi:hypothetical protein